jgi:hypothetical protein
MAKKVTFGATSPTSQLAKDIFSQCYKTAIAE